MPLFFSNAVANWVNQHQLESYIIHQNKAHFTAEFQNNPPLNLLSYQQRVFSEETVPVNTLDLQCNRVDILRTSQ